MAQGQAPTQQLWHRAITHAYKSWSTRWQPCASEVGRCRRRCSSALWLTQCRATVAGLERERGALVKSLEAARAQQVGRWSSRRGAGPLTCAAAGCRAGGGRCGGRARQSHPVRATDGHGSGATGRGGARGRRGWHCAGRGGGCDLRWPDWRGRHAPRCCHRCRIRPGLRQCMHTLVAVRFQLFVPATADVQFRPVSGAAALPEFLQEEICFEQAEAPMFTAKVLEALFGQK